MAFPGLGPLSSVLWVGVFLYKFQEASVAGALYESYCWSKGAPGGGQFTGMKMLTLVQFVWLHIQNKLLQRGAAPASNKVPSGVKETATNSALYLLNNLKSWVAPNVKGTILPGKNDSILTVFLK